MEFRSFLLVSIAAVVALASCSKDGSFQTGASGAKDVFIKINKPATRAVGAPSGISTVNFTTGHIIFTLAGGEIVKVVGIDETADHDAGKFTVTELESGIIVGKVDGNAKHCYIYSNPVIDVASKVSVGTNISVLHAEAWSLTDIDVAVANVPLYGYGQVSPAKKDGGDILRTEVKVAPVSSRIQLRQVTSADSNVKSFKIAGIYVNNYFANMNADLSFGGYRIKDNNLNPKNYIPAAADGGEGSYLTDKTVFDYNAVDGLGVRVDDKTYKASETEGHVWGYNVFPNYNLTRAELPHLIIRLDDVVVAESGQDNNIGTRYLTVVGYKKLEGASAGETVVNMESGKSYTFDNLAFTADNLSERPESNVMIDVEVAISIINWSNESVGPEWSNRPI